MTVQGKGEYNGGVEVFEVKADVFWSEKNQKELRRRIVDAESGKAKMM